MEKFMEKLVYSTKRIDKENYIELGVDNGHPVLYFYKDGDIEGFHFPYGSHFSDEMAYTIKKYKKIHNAEPKIRDIKLWRNWYKRLQLRGVINY